MPPVSFDEVEGYLRRLFDRQVRILSLSEPGKQALSGDLKGFGYGTPLFIRFEVEGQERTVVLETMSPSSFGHDHFSDRAQAILWEHSSFNELPRHIRSLDCGAVLRSGAMLSVGKAEEFFLLTEYVEGNGYFHDIDRLKETGVLTNMDQERSIALADYLADIHSRKRSEPGLYVRRLRDLLGHGECIMGLIDNYPLPFGFIDQQLMQQIEEACLKWRWKIKSRVHRLSQVHGDFHPWNILFRGGTDFSVLDRSRGEWGEPADDTTCLTMNYLFASILRSGRMDAPFEHLYRLFWDRYLERSGDQEMLDIAAPFLAWRGLVIASPIWYPRLPAAVRKTLFAFIQNVLGSDRFDYANVNRYLA